MARGRRSIRLQDYDYSQPGVYFVTICVQQRAWLLGQIEDQQMVLSPAGHIVEDAIASIPMSGKHLEIGAVCIMPNHLHLLLNFVEPEHEPGRGGVTPPLRKRLTLGQVVGRFKYATTKYINELQATPGARFWQRNYYERIVRSETEYAAVYNYIFENPRNWDKDEYR